MDDDVDLRERLFHNLVREYIIGFLLFLALYVTSYAILCAFKRRPDRDEYSIASEDAIVYRVSLLSCTFTLAVSFGAVMLLPLSIIANEAILSFPNSYYLQWVNSSLIYGLWNSIFLSSNLSLFVFMPFAYLFTESEGFPGSKRGIMSRVYETALVFLLFCVALCGLAWVIFALTSGENNRFMYEIILDVKNFYLFYLYSCVSFLGVAMLLICTPVGFTRLFGVIGELIMNTDNSQKIYESDIDKVILEEASAARKNEMALLPPSSFFKVTPRSSSFNDVHKDFDCQLHYRNNHLSPSSPSSSTSTTKKSSNTNGLNSLHTSLTSPLFSSSSLLSDSSSCIYHQNLLSFRQSNSSLTSPTTTLTTTLLKPNNQQQQEQKNNDNQSIKTSSLYFARCLELEKKHRRMFLRRKLVYPLAMVALLFLMSISLLMVSLNIAELVIRGKVFRGKENFDITLGVSSLSLLGPVGAGVEVIIIVYLMSTSLVGIYSLPGFKKLLPKRHDTPMTIVIANCVVILVLSSALPVLSRTLGISNFDLLGSYGQLEWLESFYTILIYNVIFVIVTAICLTKRLTGSVTKVLFPEIKHFFIGSVNTMKHTADVNIMANTSTSTTFIKTD